MIVQADAASETVEELGEAGTVMFCDLNEGATAFKRNFVTQMRDCDQVERCLRYISEKVAAWRADLPADADEYGESSALHGPSGVERLPSSFGELRTSLREIDSDLKQLDVSEVQLATNYSHLIELSHVLQKCDDIFSEARHSESTVVPRSLSVADLAAAGGAPASAEPLPHAPRVSASPSGSTHGGASFFPSAPGGGIDLEGGLRSHASTAGLTLSGNAETRLGYIAGVVSRARLSSFERVVFRATRGNMYLRHADIAQQVCAGAPPLGTRWEPQARACGTQPAALSPKQPPRSPQAACRPPIAIATLRLRSRPSPERAGA